MMNFLRLFSTTLSVVAALLAAQPGYGQTPETGSLSFYQGDSGHSGYISTTTAQILSVQWQNTLPNVKVALSTPALANGVLYFGAGSHVYALNAKDGTIKWQYPADGTAASGDFDSPAAVADGKVFIGSESNSLFAFDAASGALLWQAATSGTVDSAPVVDNGTVFFGCSDGHLYALDENTQKPAWGGEFRADGPIFSSPAVADGFIYFADSNSNVYSIKESSGQKYWTYLPANGVSPGSPIVRNGLIYVAGRSSVISLFAKTASVRTTYSTPSTIVSAPTVSDTNLYVSTSDQDIYSFSLHGNLVWKSHLDDVVKTPLVVTDSYVYATSRNGVLYALDLQTGHVVWSYALQDGIVQPADSSSSTAPNLPQTKTSTAVLVENGNLYTLTDDGTITAFSATAPDHVAPTVIAETPVPATTVAGSNISFQALVTDIGSGINPASVSLTVDGYPVPVYYDPTYSLVSVKYADANGATGRARVVLPTLPDGQRTATLKIADWRGNVLTKSWSFTIDNTLDPAGSSPPIQLTRQTTGLSHEGSGSVPDMGGAGGSENGLPTTMPGQTVTGVPGAAGGAGGSNGAARGGYPAPPPGASGGGRSAFPPPPPI